MTTIFTRGQIVTDKHTLFLWGAKEGDLVELDRHGYLPDAHPIAEAEEILKNQADYLAGGECKHFAKSPTLGTSKCLTCGNVWTQSANGSWPK